MENQISITINVADFNKLYIEQLNESLSPEKITELIRKHTDKTVEDFIDDQFRSYSGTSKQIKEHLNSQLAFDVSKISVPDYNAVLVETFNQSLSQIEDGLLKERAEKLKNDLLFNAPKSIKISDLVKKYQEYLIDNFSSELEGKNNYTEDGGTVYHDFEIDIISGDYGFYDLFMKVDDLDCLDIDLKIHLSKQSEGQYTITYYHIGQNRYYYTDLTKWNEFNDFERFLYSINQAKTIIIDDIDQCPNHLERQYDGCC